MMQPIDFCVCGHHKDLHKGLPSFGNHCMKVLADTGWDAYNSRNDYIHCSCREFVPRAADENLDLKLWISGFLFGIATGISAAIVWPL